MGRKSRDGCDTYGWCDQQGLDHWNVCCPDCGNRYDGAAFLRVHRTRRPVTKRARAMYRARTGR